MSENKKCTKIHCIMQYRYELLGIILIVLATLLTIVTMDSLGIIAMYIIGAILCCHQYCLKHSICRDNSEVEQPEKKPARSRRKPKKPLTKIEERTEK